MRCIGTYYRDHEYLLYQIPYTKPNWISNIVYYDTYNQFFYSPTLANIALYARDIDGQKRDESYWSQYTTLPYFAF